MEKILKGYFIDISLLLRPKVESGKTGTKQDKKGAAKCTVEHMFQNWLAGFTVYMTLVGAKFLEQAWHLMNHLSNVLKVRDLAAQL